MAPGVVDIHVEVVDGECLDVSFVEVRARFSYAESPSTWSTALTDVGGRATFHGEHIEPPTKVTFFVGEEHDTFPIKDDACYVLET